MKPILFNTEMVRALLDGRKGVTRRAIKPQPEGAHSFSDYDEERQTFYFACGGIGSNGAFADWEEAIKAPYHPGDILYVRETWAVVSGGGIHRKYGYKADNNCLVPRWRPSIHMPKEAARIFLRVTDVRVERLQDITPEQCVAEGVEQSALNEVGGEFARGMFNDIWDSTIQKKDLPLYGYDANPWVWVIEFERISKEEAIA